jgi:hypothetical protein
LLLECEAALLLCAKKNLNQFILKVLTPLGFLKVKAYIENYAIALASVEIKNEGTTPNVYKVSI